MPVSVGWKWKVDEYRHKIDADIIVVIPIIEGVHPGPPGGGVAHFGLIPVVMDGHGHAIIHRKAGVRNQEGLPGENAKFCTVGPPERHW
jgi:hypothetical protein